MHPAVQASNIFHKKIHRKTAPKLLPCQASFSESEATQRRRASQWREVKSRSSWAPNEDTYYLRFNGANGALGLFQILPQQQHVLAPVCVFFVHMFFEDEVFCCMFFSRLLHSSAKKEKHGKTVDTLTLQKADSTVVKFMDEERAYSTNFFVKKQPKQTQKKSMNRCGFTSRVFPTLH